MRMRILSTVIKLGTIMYIMTGIFFIRWSFLEYCCTKLYCSIIRVSCTTVLYGTVDCWIGPFDNDIILVDEKWSLKSLIPNNNTTNFIVIWYIVIDNFYQIIFILDDSYDKDIHTYYDTLLISNISNAQ